MSDDVVPPPADPNAFESQFRNLARPLYEVVNQDPVTEPFPAALSDPDIERYRDLLIRSLWFYRALQRSRATVPPFDRYYGQIMCRLLAMGMSQPHELTDTIFPYLIKNPPLGFAPGQTDVYRVLVA
ncbi:MAG: hypothetical protein AAB776_01840 [Patescibacteria group bacterium]